MKFSEDAKGFLSFLAIAGILTVVITSPYFLSSIASAYLREKSLPSQRKHARRIAQAIASARRNKLIVISMKEDTYKVELSDKGKRKIKELEFYNLKIQAPEKWDKKWRIVIFDIPNTVQKTIRNTFVAKLKSLDFCLLQKSVWVHPYPCENEIQFVVEVFGISRFVSIIVADSISDETKLYRHFNLL
jgi:DNA-binding transcriptional regulator PaaX